MTGDFYRIHTIRGGIWMLFSVASAILALFIGVLYWSISSVQDVARNVERTQAIVKAMDDLMENMLNAETGQRGYLLTQDDRYLDPYRKSVARIGDDFRTLHELVRDAEVMGLLARVETIAYAKQADLAKKIALAQAGKHDEALAMVKTGWGKESMDEFRRFAHLAIETEGRLLAKRQEEFERRLNGLLAGLIIGGLATLIIMSIMTLSTIRRLGAPIAELMRGIAAMAEGDLRREIKSFADDEIGRIAGAFNSMRVKLLAAKQARDTALKELERSNADLDNFAYVASHDLKAPLRGIRNLSEWIAEDVQHTASDDTRENLRLLRSRVDRLDGLLESLLAYSRVGRKLGSAETVNSGRLVDEIGDYLAKPGFSVSRADVMPALFTPKAPLELVLRNLVNNALKHHDREQGRVTVSARETGDMIEFRIQDDGPGIAPEFHEKIFQMFQTLKPRDQVEGSGMGLAIVRKTIENFGGHIRVESNPPERGTAFVFTWPLNFETREKS